MEVFWIIICYIGIRGVSELIILLGNFFDFCEKCLREIGSFYLYFLIGIGEILVIGVY